MGRKTVDIDKLREYANTALSYRSVHSSDSPETETAFRLGIASLLERVLHDAGRYKGFGYQDSEYEQPKEGQLARDLREGYDDSRRIYY